MTECFHAIYTSMSQSSFDSFSVSTFFTKARISAANTDGYSRAGKCPPSSNVEKWTMLRYFNADRERGTIRRSFGNKAIPAGTSTGTLKMNENNITLI